MKCISIATKADLDALLGSPQKEISYRGQCNADWRLRSSLEREAQRKFGSPSPTTLGEFEVNIIDWFIEHCRKYELGSIYPTGPLPNTSDTFEWLSLLRHSGYPTRLIDFTDDLMTALFFALSGSEASLPIAIFALQMRGGDTTGNKLPKDSGGNIYLTGPEQKPNMNELLGLTIRFKSFHSHFGATSLPATWKKPTQNFGWDKPAISNIRIERQKGRFLYQLDLGVDIESAGDITKYTISPQLHASCLQILRSKGDRYSSKFLFPGFEGWEILSA